MDGEELYHQVQNVTSYINISVGVLGLLGNIICSRVMLTNSLKHISSSVFFFFIGIVDSINIISTLIRDIAVHTTLSSDDILFGGNEWRCRFGHYGLQTCRTASSWLVIALVAELYLATRSPAKAKVIYTRWRSLRVSIYISLLACAGSLPFLVIHTGDGQKCTPQYEIFVEVYSDIIMRPIVIFIFPLVLCGFCLVRVFKTLSNNENTVIEQQASGSYTDDKVLEELFKHGYQAKTGILAVAVVFICCVLPSVVLDVGLIIQKYAEPEETFVDWNWQTAELITRCLLLINYTTKFYIIIALEDDFKQALSYVFTCGLFAFDNQANSQQHSDFHDLATVSHATSNGYNGTVVTSNGIKYVNNNVAYKKKRSGLYIAGSRYQRRRNRSQNTQFQQDSRN